MLGSVLRIDIDNGDPYGIPDDNPKVSVNYPEIWAFGFRNPYRMAFDMGGEHELFLGDAGQELWEEVSIVVAGGNYGWNVREGTHCFSTAYPGIPDAILDCPTQDPQGNPLIDPIIEFPNLKHPDGGLGSTIVGGVVYRGSILPAWDGRYIFGQWSIGSPVRQGGLSVAERSDQGLWNFEKIQIVNHENEDLGAFLLALGQDLEGEVYVLTSQNVGPSGHTGVVYRIREP
jgi:glucose/arabinose dehydrogenase